MAVLGTAVFGDARGAARSQYPIFQTVAGNALYDVPTIDGEPNRLLLQRFG